MRSAHTVEIRPGTAADIAQLLAGEPAPRSAYWVVAAHGERVLGGGAAFIAGSHWSVVCRIQPDIQAQLVRYRRPLLVAAQHLIAVTRTRRLPVLAEPDPSIPGAVSFLEHLGFRRLTGNLYRLEGAHG